MDVPLPALWERDPPERALTMSPQTKLTIRRFTLRWLRKLVDVADDRLHSTELALREEIASVGAARSAADGKLPGQNSANARFCAQPGDSQAGKETFLQWEARRSGVAPVSKKATRQRRERLTAAGFDLRYSVR